MNNEVLSASIIKNQLKCKSIESKYILSLINKGISKQYLYENYSNNYKDNIDIMKNNKIYLEDYFKGYKDSEGQSESRARFENFNDDCAKTLIKHLAKKLMRTISSSQKIFNKDTYNLFQTLAELEVSVDFIKDNIAKKIKALDTTELLNEALKKHVDTFSDWSLPSKLKTINKEYTHIISTANNRIIFEVEDFKGSKSLGSPMWCIARDKDDFNDYRKDADRVIFCYDFNKEPTDNAHKTAYIVNARGGVINGYFNNDDFMDKSENSCYEEYFDSYNIEEFLNRLEEKSNSKGSQLLLMIANNFEEDIEEFIEDLDFNTFDVNEFRNFIGRNNEAAVLKIINKYPVILKECGSFNGELLESLVNYGESVNYSNFGCDILIDIFKNEELVNLCLGNKMDFFNDALFNISLSGYRNEEMLLTLMSNNKYSIIEDVKGMSEKHYALETFKLLNGLKNNESIKEEIKKDKKSVFAMCTCYHNKTAFEYLDLSKEKDMDLINYLIDRAEEEKDSIETGALYSLNKKLASFSENGKQAVIDTIKKVVIKSPRQLMSMRKELEEKNVIFSKEETLDMFSKIIFEENYDKAKTLINEEILEDIEYFRLPEVFQKKIFGSTSVNLEGLNEFVNFLNKVKGESEIVDSKISKISSYSPIDFLLTKEHTNKKENKNKPKN